MSGFLQVPRDVQIPPLCIVRVITCTGEPGFGIHQRGVQSEGGAVDWGSII